MPRDRDDRDDEDEDEAPPRRRRRRRDEDDEDDDDGLDRPARRSLGPLDGMYRDTNVVILVLFPCCCGIIAFILSAVCFFTARDEKAKSNALMVMIISGVLMVLGVVAQFTGQLGQFKR